MTESMIRKNNVTFMNKPATSHFSQRRTAFARNEKGRISKDDFYTNLGPTTSAAGTDFQLMHADLLLPEQTSAF